MVFNLIGFEKLKYWFSITVPQKIFIVLKFLYHTVYIMNTSCCARKLWICESFQLYEVYSSYDNEY